MKHDGFLEVTRIYLTCIRILKSPLDKDKRSWDNISRAYGIHYTCLMGVYCTVEWSDLALFFDFTICLCFMN